MSNLDKRIAALEAKVTPETFRNCHRIIAHNEAEAQQGIAALVAAGASPNDWFIVRMIVG